MESTSLSHNSRQAPRQSPKKTNTLGVDSSTALQGQEKKFKDVCIEDIIILEVCAYENSKPHEPGQIAKADLFTPEGKAQA